MNWLRVSNELVQGSIDLEEKDEFNLKGELNQRIPKKWL
jgi:hypothetical protein